MIHSRQSDHVIRCLTLSQRSLRLQSSAGRALKVKCSTTGMLKVTLLRHVVSVSGRLVIDEYYYGYFLSAEHYAWHLTNHGLHQYKHIQADTITAVLQY